MGPRHSRRLVAGRTRPVDVAAPAPVVRHISLGWPAIALAAAGSAWIASLPTVTHSPLDSPLGGALVRLLFYVPVTLAALVTARALIDRLARRGPVRAAVALAALAVLAGSAAETAARLILGHGDVLAADGVLQRAFELARVDVPVAAVAVIGVAWARRTPIRR